MSSDLKEASLREAKAELVERVADQQRALGQLANLRAVEQHVAPIIEKISRDAASTPAPAARPAPAEGIERRDVAQVALSAHQRGARVDKVLDAKAFARRRSKTAQQLAWEVTARAIYSSPEYAPWRERLENALHGPTGPGHALSPCPECAARACKVRESRLAAVVREFWAANGGDPQPAFERALKKAAAKGRR
jgi:hypothetical protein